MLSYAENAEDVVLARAFAAQSFGFYLDVGARHPELGSVTKHFYDRGWCGINVALTDVERARLAEARPRDVNLCVALPDRPDQGCRYQTGEGELLTLADVCARYASAAIDVLRICVEGRGAEVIRGRAWERAQPRVLVVAESTPCGSRPEPWESVICAAGYQHSLFDGLNRFYVRAEEPTLLPRLTVPANSHDDWEPHRYVSKITELERQVASLEQQVTDWQAHAAGVMRYATDVREHFERCETWAKILQRKVRRFEEHLGLLPDTLPPPRR